MISDPLAMEKRRDPVARRLLFVGLGLLALWTLWAIVYETTGLPGLNYLAFGFVSLPTGLILLLASGIAYRRASVHGFRKTDALGAIAVSVVLGVLPWIMLLNNADYS
jgi:hypothetical protein